jgi:hypothetical protein
MRYPIGSSVFAVNGTRHALTAERFIEERNVILTHGSGAKNAESHFQQRQEKMIATSVSPPTIANGIVVRGSFISLAMIAVC